MRKNSFVGVAFPLPAKQLIVSDFDFDRVSVQDLRFSSHTKVEVIVSNSS